MSANFLKPIRARLGVTQSAMAEALGVTQGNIYFYERGQMIPPAVAAKLIDFAKSKNVALSFDDIYAEYRVGTEDAPDAPAPEARG